MQIDMKKFVERINYYFSENEINNIFEIGSMDGADAIFLKNNFFSANVVAIEGLEENYLKYMKNIDNITCINCVVAEYDGFIKYHKKNINGIHGILNRGDEYGTEILNYPCKTVETICKELNIQSIDVIKLDVEGASYEILTSMKNMLQDVKIMHIETESYPFFKNQVLHQQVSDFLIKNNFVLDIISDIQIKPGCFQHDSIWVNAKYFKK